MPNTYTQLYIQFVFVVKMRERLIGNTFRDELEKVICGLVSEQKCKPIAIYCMPDHTHLLVSMHPTVSPSKLMEVVKSASTKWLHEKKCLPGKFAWQDGYGAFTYSKSQIQPVINYILNQPEHHYKKTFREEYVDLLQQFDIAYNEKYLFDFFD